MSDVRYPYTYAADYLRSVRLIADEEPVPGVVSPRLGRRDASAIRRAIADAIGMSDETLAIMLADRYLETQEQPRAIQP